jgi:MFS family permease
MGEENFTPADRSQEGGTASALLTTWLEGLRLIGANRVLRVIVVATFVVAMVDETVDRLDFLRMRELGFPDLDGADSALLFGGIWVGMSLLTIPAMVVVGRRVDQAGDRRSALLMAGFLAAGAIGVGFMAGSIFALAIVGWVIRDVMREVVEPVGEAWTNRHATSSVRATVISFRSQSMAFGEIVGGLTLGLVAELVGLSVAFGAGAVLLAIAALQFGWLVPSTDPKSA